MKIERELGDEDDFLGLGLESGKGLGMVGVWDLRSSI